MDRFKFRVWDVKYRKMWNSDNELCISCIFECLRHAITHKTDDVVIIEQCTGLKDKNSKLIYEGDIVKYKVKGSDKTYTTVMKFNEDHGAFLFGIYEGVKMPCGKKTRMNKYTRKSVGSVEVIGNIYENPGLLEGN